MRGDLLPPGTEVLTCTVWHQVYTSPYWGLALAHSIQCLLKPNFILMLKQIAQFFYSQHLHLPWTQKRKWVLKTFFFHQWSELIGELCRICLWTMQGPAANFLLVISILCLSTVAKSFWCVYSCLCSGPWWVPDQHFEEHCYWVRGSL